MPAESSAPTNPLASVAVLIPAWRPELVLAALAADLQLRGFGLILVVDDGSPSACASVFEAAERHGAQILRHAVNLGKGRALKTGFHHLLLCHPSLIGVVTADADGQHTAQDIVRLAHSFLQNSARPVLGVRRFRRGVPLRSQIGNLTTRYIFALITGTKLSDTQSGLRALPLSLLPRLLPLQGERYEYEMTVLAHLCRTGQRPLEVPIETVYLEGNRSSHFNPVRDSMRIYFVLARFYVSSLFAAVIDFAGFALAFALTHNILISVVLGRLSSLINFALNKGFVFHNRGPLTIAFGRYYALAIAVAALSYALILLTVTRLHWNVFAAKVLVDATLSLVSFSVQRTFIFARPEEA